MKKWFTILLLLSYSGVFAQKNYAGLVNPFIGTGGHGHTYPGATLPHGMVQLSPDTRLDGWDGCGGYHYSDSFIYGFSHTHLSGTGVSDYGDILLMPMSGRPSPDNKIYGSAFLHSREKAWAGYYSVWLQDDNIQTEFTATERVGLHHYTYSSMGNNNIILDLLHRDEVLESSLLLEDSVTVSGMRRSKAWANDQYVFFIMKFSRPVKDFGVWQAEQPVNGLPGYKYAGKNIKAWFNFEMGKKENDILVKVALSSVSTEGARENLNQEMPGWNFNQIKDKAAQKWDQELSKIEVEDEDENKIRIFYTALYHTAIVPNINMDIDGQYRGRDNKIHKADGFTNYSVFSLWDTYRAAHPLYTIIDRKRSLDYIKTFLVQYEQGGRLPVWELAGNETDCMIGYHSVPVIVDAYVKGINKFDTLLALNAMKKSANWVHLGLPAFINKGIIEAGDEHESVSKTLEYAYDDFCISLFAGKLGKVADESIFLKRAQYYKNLLDIKTQHMRPKKNGGWIEPFDPREVNNHFTEANSWQYSFYMQQDIGGYLKLVGGRKNLEKKLDELFKATSQTTGRDQSDITGLIGQYAHGNEPSHHIAYLYDYTGAAYKTQEMVHKIMNEFYRNTPDGLIGNEDCGQMSAWYVLSAMGFYPVTPGLPAYALGTPHFSSITINLENGRKFLIKAEQLSNRQFYIGSAAYTGNDNVKFNLNSPQISHEMIAAGGTLNFLMSDKPGKFKNEINVKDIGGNENAIVINPSINGGAISFKKDKRINISTPQKNVRIYYTTNGTIPTAASSLYNKEITINSSQTIQAVAIDEIGKRSFTVAASFKKLAHDWSISLNTPFEKQYDAGGAGGLIDGLRGEADWRRGNWQGYQLHDMDVLIDLKSLKQVSEVRIGFLQDTRAWIIMPKEMTVEVSSDNHDFKKVYEGKNFLAIDDLETRVFDVKAEFLPVQARYIRIRAKQYGKLPSWHLGAGGNSHIFTDEIMVK